MFEFEFHIHLGSITDWIQATAAVVGVIFLILNFRKLNHQIRISKEELRENIKPNFVSSPHPSIFYNENFYSLSLTNNGKTARNIEFNSRIFPDNFFKVRVHPFRYY